MNVICKPLALLVLTTIFAPCGAEPIVGYVDRLNDSARPERPIVVREFLRPSHDPNSSELVNQIVGEQPFIQLVPPSAEELPPTEPDDDAMSGDDDLKPIGDLSTDILPSEGELPPDHAAPKFEAHGVIDQTHNAIRRWEYSEYYWEAPALVHQPLYFEDENLERYGYSHGVLQPAVSTVHFLSRFVMLPYLSGARRPRECVYAFGYYRPGSCAPHHYHRPPLSIHGLGTGVISSVGLVFLLP